MSDPTPVDKPAAGTPTPAADAAEQTLPSFERSFLALINLHRRSFDLTDERFMIILLGFLQSWVGLPHVRSKAARDLEAAEYAALGDAKRDVKTLSYDEKVAAVVSSIMEVKI